MNVSSTTHKIIIAVVFIMAAALGFFLFHGKAGEDRLSSQTISNASSTSVLATTAGSTTTRNGVTGTGNFAVSNEPTLDVPDFRAAVHFATDTTDDLRQVINQKVALVQSALAKDSLNPKLWLDLGTLYKIGGDWSRAEQAWVFVTQASPNNTAAYWNLADLNMNFLKNYPKAEAEYKKVIALDPTNTSAYTALFGLYSTVYMKGTSAAENILKQGIQANPKAVDLEVQLARYYRAVGRIPDAISEYDIAITNATTQGLTDLANQIKAEKGQQQ